MGEETYEAYDVLMNTAGPLVSVTAGVIGLGLLDKARREFRGRVTPVPAWSATAVTVVLALGYGWVSWEVAKVGFYSFALLPLFVFITPFVIKTRQGVHYLGIGPDRFADELERQVLASGRTIEFALDGIWISGLSGPLNSGHSDRSGLSSLETWSAEDSAEAARLAASVAEALSESSQPSTAAGVRSLLTGVFFMGIFGLFVYGKWAGHL